MMPFYIWFTVVSSSLIAAMVAGAFPVTLPVPWTGLLLFGLILSVSVLPMLYGRTYIRDVSLGCGRGESSARIGDDDGATITSFPEASADDYRLEDDLLEGEAFPLLGSMENVVGVHVVGLDTSSLTWRQCLHVSRVKNTQLLP